MQYFHQARYGNAGGIHSARPQFVAKGNAVYATIFNKEAPKNVALFNIKNNHLPTTMHHAEGINEKATYRIDGNKVHTTIHHADHKDGMVAFELKDHF